MKIKFNLDPNISIQSSVHLKSSLYEYIYLKKLMVHKFKLEFFHKNLLQFTIVIMLFKGLIICIFKLQRTLHEFCFDALHC